MKFFDAKLNDVEGAAQTFYYYKATFMFYNITLLLRFSSSDTLKSIIFEVIRHYVLLFDLICVTLCQLKSEHNYLEYCQPNEKCGRDPPLFRNLL